MKRPSKPLFSARLPTNIIDFIKSKTDDNPELKQADVVEDAVNRMMTGHTDEEYQAIIKSKEDEIEQAHRQIEEIEKRTGIKVQRTKKISFTVTLEQYNIINNLAYENKTSKADLVRKVMFPETPKIDNMIQQLE